MKYDPNPQDPTFQQESGTLMIIVFLTVWTQCGWFYPEFGEGRIRRSFTEELKFKLDLKNKESSSIKPNRRRSGRGVSYSRGPEACKTKQVEGQSGIWCHWSLGIDQEAIYTPIPHLRVWPFSYTWWGAIGRFQAGMWHNENYIFKENW